MTAADHHPEPAPPVGHSRFYLLRRLGRLIRKEVSTILRDRRTIITLILMPLLLYPLLTIAFQQFLLSSELEKKQQTEYRIGMLKTDKAEANLVDQVIQSGDKILDDLTRDPQHPLDKAFREQPPPVAVRPPILVDDLEQALKSGEIDVGIRLRGLREGTWVKWRDQACYCDIYYVENSVNGLAAKAWIERRIAAFNDQQAFRRLGLTPGRIEIPVLSAQIVTSRSMPTLASGITQYVTITRLQDAFSLRRLPRMLLISSRAGAMKSSAKEPSLPVSTLLPLILILMTITGAVYPSIDLTAGERERGTLEVLVAAPVPRLGLLFAKYVSVVIVAVLTATVNVVCMTITLAVTPLGKQLISQSGLTGLALVEIFGLLLLFAAFFSAVLLAVTSFARSFKEAQAYLIPLMLVSLTPGIMALMPDLKLDGGLSVVPLLNIVLLTRNLFDPAQYGTVPLWTAAVVVLSTLIYALAAVGVAARVFGAEAVLYNEQSNWGDLFRRPPRSQPAATVSGALLCLALLFPLAFVLNGSLSGLDASMLTKILLQAATTILLFGLIPLFAAWMGRVRRGEAFRIEACRVRAWLPALLLGLSIWPLTSLIEQATRDLYASEFRERLVTAATDYFKRLRELSPVVLVIAMGIIPALLEELFFRGYLLSALLRKTQPAVAIIASSVLFGLFHLAGAKLILVEQFIITTTLGIILGWICWRTGSIFPGVLLHAAHNTSLLLVAYYNPQLSGNELPILWVIGAGVIVVLGATLMYFTTRSMPAPNVQSALPAERDKGTDDFRSWSSPLPTEGDRDGNRPGNQPLA